jgi:isocitrate dehydrogenase
MISNRGTKVYPAAGAITDCVDHWFCRFVGRSGDEEVTDQRIIDLVGRVGKEHRWTHIEKLHEFNGQPGFTKAQGED